jgi:hypothetical protein
MIPGELSNLDAPLSTKTFRKILQSLLGGRRYYFFAVISYTIREIVVTFLRDTGYVQYISPYR